MTERYVYGIVTIERYEKDYTICIDDCYIGTYDKAAANMLLKSLNCPEIDF